MFKKFQSIILSFTLIAGLAISPASARRVIDLGIQGLQTNNGVPDDQRVLLQFVGRDNIVKANGTDEAQVKFVIRRAKNLRLPENSVPVVEVKEILDDGSKINVGDFSVKASKKNNIVVRGLLKGLRQSGNQYEFTLLGENGKTVERFTGTFFPDGNLSVSDVSGPALTNNFNDEQIIEIARKLPNHLMMAMVPSKFNGVVPRMTDEGSRFDIHFKATGKNTTSKLRGRVINVQNEIVNPTGGTNFLSGTAAQRPATVAPGTIYFATDTNQVFGNTSNSEAALTLLVTGGGGSGGAGTPGPAGPSGGTGAPGAAGANCFDAPGITDQNGNGTLDVGDCVIAGGGNNNPVTNNETQSLALNTNPVAFNTPLNNINGANAIARRITITNGVLLNNEQLIIGLDTNGNPVNVKLPLTAQVTNLNTAPTSLGTSLLVQDMLLRVFIANGVLNLVNVESFPGVFTPQSPVAVYSTEVLQ